MFHRLLLFFPLIILHLNALAQETTYQLFPEINGQDAVQTSATHDKGIIICHKKGTSNGFRLLKFDSIGNLLWNHDYGIYSSNGYFNKSIIETKDHGFLIAGNYNQPFSNRGIMLVRTDSAGELLWLKQYRDTVSDIYAWDVAEKENGGFIIEGFSYTKDICVISVNQHGNLIWEKQLDNFQNIFVNSSHILQDGDKFMIESWDYGGIARIDTTGNIIWNKYYWQYPVSVCPKEFIKTA